MSLRNIILSICFLLCCGAVSNAQQYSSIRRLTYDRMGLFYDTGFGVAENINNSTEPPKNYNLGNTAGLQINVNPSYLGQNNDSKFVLGWSLNLEMGYNFNSPKVAPYVFDLGIWGGYLLTENLELGFQYCFLGVYGYQTLAHFGASFSPALRYKRFQLTYIRRGAGAIRGCFVPKDSQNNFPQHSVELAYNLGKTWIVGTRYTGFKSMSKDRPINEFRLFVAITILQDSFSRKAKPTGNSK